MMQTLLVGGADDLSYRKPTLSNGNSNRTYENSIAYQDENNLSIQSKSLSVKSMTQFEKLVDNLKNNPEYRKEIFLNRLIGFYRIGSEIGIGNFSQVRLGLHLLTKEKVAIKILNKTKLDEKTQRLLLREISSMQKLHHPNIIRLYEVIHTQERLFICMEYAPEGELYTRITSDGKINEMESRIIFSQIISAVHHMHSCNIIHRDIKAENIFFSNLSPINVKIGDFGFSIEASMDKQLNTYCGSPPYAAPELFRDDSYIGIYVDIWALGVLLYFIVTGLMPFKADTVGKLKRVILNGDYVIPSFVSDSCQLLIRGILRPVPADRFSIKEIMESAWLDSEKFTENLEPYQLNPTQDKSLLKPEEIYSIKILENLGISQDYLIISNLNDATQVLHNTKQNTIMNNLINNRTLLTNVTNIYQNRLNQINLTPELKQSINGTYRIIYHCIQKKMRKEHSSELETNTFFNKEFASLNMNTIRATNRNSSIDSGNVIRNRKLVQRNNSNDQDDYDEEDEEEEINYYEKTPKSLIAAPVNGAKPPNSIFVKTNNQINPASTNTTQAKNVNNNSIFVKYNANNKPQQMYKTDGQVRQVNQNGINAKHKQQQQSKQQQSKFCTIL